MTPNEPSTTGTLLFRPDVSPAIGTGHLMRCLALAELCTERGHSAVFALHDCPAALAVPLRAAGMDTVELACNDAPAELVALARRLSATALVVDGYHFDADYRETLATSDLPVLAVDDGNLHYPLYADIVLNSSPLASPGHYVDIAPHARLLLGPGYAPLRREFRESSARLPDTPPSSRVLLTFGGSDPAALTLPVTRALLDVLPEDAVLDVVLGGAVGDTGAIDDLADAQPARVTLHRNTTRMAALMSRARFAVSAAGSTLWELACLAVPGVAVVVADNQAGNLETPVCDWFQVIDARPGTASATPKIAAAALALWQHAGMRARREASLRALQVGQRAPDICYALGQLGHDAA